MPVEIITRDEFESFIQALAGDRTWSGDKDPVNGEWYYIIDFDPKAGVMVRSSIVGRESRGAGQDSIRVYPIDLASRYPLGSKLERWIQRTSGWRKHLLEDVTQFATWRERAGDCPVCHLPKEFHKVKKPGANNGRPFAVCFEHYKPSFVFLDEEQTNEQAEIRHSSPVLTIAGNVAVAHPEPASNKLDPMRAFTAEPIPGGIRDCESSTQAEDLSELFESLETVESTPTAQDAPTVRDSDRSQLAETPDGGTDAPLVRSSHGASVKISVPPVIPPSFRILPSDIIPSRYQRDFYYMCAQGNKHTVLIAKAGSGKTRTQIEGLQYFDPRLSVGVAAFGKDIAKSFQARAPKNVKVGTFHSLALGAVMKEMPHLKLAVGGDRDDAIDKMEICYNLVTQGANKGQKYVVLRLVSLCKSMLLEPTEAHLDWLTDRYTMDVPSTAKGLIYDLTARVYAKSLEMNSSMVDFNDLIWLIATDAVRVKPFDRFLVDEAQDMDPAQIQMSLRMGKVVFCVGDPNQCQPAGTLVATCVPGTRGKPESSIEWRQIETLSVGDKIISLDRHGHTFAKSAIINAIASRPYKGHLIHVVANNNHSQCTPNHKWLVRWNKNAENAWVTYLMRRGNSFRVGMTKMFRNQPEAKNNLGFGLGIRARVERADDAWILRIHKSQKEAAVYEQVLAIRYGIPQCVFLAPSNHVHFSQDVIDELYEELGDLTAKAKLCLSDHGRDIQYPLYSNKSQGKQGKNGRKTVFTTQACNLISEYMMVPTVPNNETLGTHIAAEWHPVYVNREYFDGLVYSMDVEKHHNYVADGLVTCNSIYAFRGADSEAMPKLIDALDATVLPLSICYRCPKSSIRLAQKYVSDIEWRPDAPEGILDDIHMSKFNPQPGDLNVSRVNSALIKPCLSLIRRGIKAAIVGRDIGKGIRSLLDRGQQMADTDNLSIILQTLSTYTEIEVAKLVSINKMSRAEFVQEQFDCLVAISEACTGVADIRQKIDITFSDQVTPIRFSSVHRAKGLEANTVHILKPQLLPLTRKNQQPWEEQQERNVTYVAYTRNKKALHFVLDD